MSDLAGDLQRLAAAAQDPAVDIRRTLHRRPELAFEEYETTALIRARLGALGLETLPCPTETGAVYGLQGGLPGRTVLLRADIDALPVTEETDVAFKSEIEGRMHACGHDAHVAILLGTAGVLAQRAESLAGRYIFLFQPAEEAIRGAAVMIEGGVLEGLGAERVIGLHIAAPLPTGLVGVRPGVQMSRAQVFRATLRGRGGHGSMAGVEGNVVLAASALATRLPGVVEGLESDWVRCACSAGVIRAGTASNVVPREAVVEGSHRTFDEEQYAVASARLLDLFHTIETEFEVTGELELPAYVPEVVNDAAAVEAFRRGAAAAIGAANVIEVPPSPPSDDVSEFMRLIPGVYYMLGARPGTGDPPMHHAPDFNIDEAALEVGVKTMVAGAVALAGEPG